MARHGLAAFSCGASSSFRLTASVKAACTPRPELIRSRTWGCCRACRIARLVGTGEGLGPEITGAGGGKRISLFTFARRACRERPRESTNRPRKLLPSMENVKCPFYRMPVNPAKRMRDLRSGRFSPRCRKPGKLLSYYARRGNKYAVKRCVNSLKLPIMRHKV